MAISSLIKMDKLCKSQKISFGVKLRLLRVIVISGLLYGCESWTYSEEILKKINAFEFKCHRRLLGISWRDRRTNESVKERVEGLDGVQKPLIQIAQERKMKKKKNEKEEDDGLNYSRFCSNSSSSKRESHSDHRISIIKHHTNNSMQVVL